MTSNGRCSRPEKYFWGHQLIVTPDITEASELPRFSLGLVERRPDPFFDLIPTVAVSLAVPLAQLAFSQRPSQFGTFRSAMARSIRRSCFERVTRAIS